MPRDTRKKLYILMFNLFIIMVGIGLVIPILPFYVQSFGASAGTLGILVALYSIMQFIMAPIWGRLADKFGRKPVLSIGLLGFAIAEFVFAFANGLWMLFLSRIVAGTFGSAVMPSAMAYVSDCTTVEERPKGMGYLGAAMGAGIVVGPAIGGWLAEIVITLPFFVAGFAAIVALGFSLLFLPESLTSMECKASKVQLSFIQQCKMAFHTNVGALLIFVLIMSFGLSNFQATFGFFAIDHFQLKPSHVGFIYLFVGLVGTVVQAFYVAKLVKRYGNINVVVSGFIISGLGFILILLSPTYIFLFITTGVFSLGNALLRPSLNALISRMSEGNQGVMMGLTNSCLSLGNALGPLLAGSMYRMRGYFPFTLGAIIMFISPYFVVRWKKQVMRLKINKGGD